MDGIMNNEPVAWMSASGSFNKKETWIFHIPLYTHPVKELTDEEILQFRDKVPYSLGSDLIEFARAILRKVQKK
jgi:hypothetical protein